jgi:predicted regulator of amino acid metabolism with ACT domain
VAARAGKHWDWVNGRRKRNDEREWNAGVMLEEVLSAENPDEAWARVKANAGAAGVDRRSVAQTAKLIRVHKEKLLELLLA